MKKLCITLLSLCLLVISIEAQTLKERLNKAGKIYIAPIRPTFYFMMDKSSPPKPFRDIAAKGEGQTGLMPSWYKEYNAYWEANKDKYLFDPNKIYSIGDTICTNQVLLPDQLSNGWYTIVNTIPKETLDAINTKLITKCEELFGRKVEMWPEDKYISDKAWEYYDEKEAECDFYLMSEITSDQQVKLFIENANGKWFIGRANNSNSGMLPTNFVRFTLFEKTKPGKKGKKVADAYETIFEKIEDKELQMTTSFPKELGEYETESGIKFRKEALDAGRSYSDEILKSLSEKYPEALSKFFSKLEKSLDK